MMNLQVYMRSLQATNFTSIWEKISFGSFIHLYCDCNILTNQIAVQEVDKSLIDDLVGQ